MIGMKGMILGDLAAWTWQNDRGVFYSHLISENAVLSEYGATAIAMVEPIWEGKEITEDYVHGHLQNYLFYKTELSDDVDSWIKSNNNQMPFNKVRNLVDVLYAICGWKGVCQESAREKGKTMNDSLNRRKEEFYASMILPQLIWLLRNGFSKKDAIEKEWSFPEVLNWDKSLDGPMGAIARAWDAFYRAFDFTSTIHSAVKSPVNPRLTACIAGAFAEAMYGCDMGFLKKKYTGNPNGMSFQICLPEYLLTKYQSELSFIGKKKEELRIFFPKNCAKTNVERHVWTPVENIYADKKISYELRRRIQKAFYISSDDRYGFYLDDGWVYVYRSFRLICRFKLVEEKDGIYRITRIERSEEAIDYKKAMMEAMYSVEHRWSLVSGEPL